MEVCKLITFRSDKLFRIKTSFKTVNKPHHRLLSARDDIWHCCTNSL